MLARKSLSWLSGSQVIIKSANQNQPRLSIVRLLFRTRLRQPTTVVRLNSTVGTQLDDRSAPQRDAIAESYRDNRSTLRLDTVSATARLRLWTRTFLRNLFVNGCCSSSLTLEVRRATMERLQFVHMDTVTSLFASDH